MNHKKRLLILNGSHSEIPLIKAAKNLGFYVITTGNEPTLIGHSFADEYHHADYSNKIEILELAQRLDIEAICSCANDFGIITAAWVAEKLGLAGHDSYQTTLLLHHKDSFKKFADQHELPTPKATDFCTPEDAIQNNTLQFPVIIKPVDLTGGKGVSIVEDIQEYKTAVLHAFNLSKQKRIVVEPFFEGSLHSLSTFLIQQKVHFSYCDNEYSWKNPFYVCSSGSPATHGDQHRNKLVTAIEKIARELKLVDGIFHIQYLANEHQATIIDITRRCSGDMYPIPVSYSTGIEWAEWIIMAETGLPCHQLPTIEQSGYYSRHCIMTDNNGIVNNITISEKIRPYIVDELYWWKKGDTIHNYLIEKLGIIFLSYPDKKTMENITPRLPEYIKIT